MERMMNLALKPGVGFPEEATFELSFAGWIEAGHTERTESGSVFLLKSILYK
jgi:hypothetical protein